MWNRVARPSSEPAPMLGSRAQAVADHLRAHGAAFYDEIVDGTGMLRTDVETALAELVVQGVASSDSFAGLRTLLTPSEKRKPFGGRRGRRGSVLGIEDAGRWALRSGPAPVASDAGAAAVADADVQNVVHALLRRYGVIFWRLLQREGSWLPPWREMLRVLRRLEARGEIRGGRFVAGVSGEQFALPDVVASLRKIRRTAAADEYVVVSGIDPLNLVGVLLPGAKVPALAGNRILYRDGIPVATLVGGEVEWRVSLDADEARTAEDILRRRNSSTLLLLPSRKPKAA